VAKEKKDLDFVTFEFLGQCDLLQAKKNYLQNLLSCLGCWFFPSLVFTAWKQKNLFLMILTLFTTTSWIQTKQSS
jgi:hypothetical protein